MAAATCATAATTVRATARVAASNRAAFCTGARLRPAAAAARVPAARGREMMATRALFGGGAATKGSIYDYSVKSIDGKDINMSQFKGKVLLIINVASACGFTPQYTEMTELQNKYNGQGLEVLAFPCNQFGAQEPGSNSEIKSFAERKGFKGPMFAKSDVNGPDALPLFGYLKSAQGGLLTADIKWNFTKFLVDRSGNVVKRYGSTTSPMQIESDIKALL
ncbi:glutathione peroxidase [Chlorella sorokiniana]|jgi:glutathione peroxidase|uniref:Glutathione peroxidase n=1 Tax=Chlorella sorokiniana TaxID=3076 RepID=A0A2P6TI90_CHLSO|nr:glutathione peroxidase [Chlorella sorokiniana]|eukprot:PRW33989.1 glutathione peroxidase [Chlorella sorokiniana]